MKASIDMYEVKYEGRIYKVLKFPYQKHMYVYDWSYERTDDDCTVDASMHCFPHIRNACAILASNPDVIVYFPSIQHDEDKWKYAGGDLDLVMYRSELQFKRSRWNHIRRSLTNSTYKGRYIYTYSPEDLEKEYYELEPKVRYKYRRRRRNTVSYIDEKIDYCDGRTLFTEGWKIFFLWEFLATHQEIIDRGNEGGDRASGYADFTSSNFLFYISNESLKMMLGEKQSNKPEP